MHHDDGTGGFYIPLLLSFTNHTFPVVLLNTLLHHQLMVEVVVLIPPVPYTCNQCHQQQPLKNHGDCPLCAKLAENMGTVPVIHVADRHQQEESS